MVANPPPMISLPLAFSTVSFWWMALATGGTIATGMIMWVHGEHPGRKRRSRRQRRSEYGVDTFAAYMAVQRHGSARPPRRRKKKAPASRVASPAEYEDGADDVGSSLAG